MALFWMSVSGSGWGRASCSAIQALRSRYETGSSKMAAPTGAALRLQLAMAVDTVVVVVPSDLLRFGDSCRRGEEYVEKCFRL